MQNLEHLVTQQLSGPYPHAEQLVLKLLTHLLYFLKQPSFAQPRNRQSLRDNYRYIATQGHYCSVRHYI